MLGTAVSTHGDHGLYVTAGGAGVVRADDAEVLNADEAVILGLAQHDDHL